MRSADPAALRAIMLKSSTPPWARNFFSVISHAVSK